MFSILHLGKFYPPHRGGMEQHVYDLVSRQSSRYKVSVLCCADTQRTSCELRDGAEITRVANLGRVASMPFCPEILWRVRDYRPDLVHLHTPNPLGAAALAMLRHHCAVVVEHHSDTVGRRVLKQLCAPVVTAAMRRADKVIATSGRYLDSSRELAPYREKTVVVPCGINLPEPTLETLAMAEQLRQTWQDRLIVAVGRLVPYKGFDVLINAMCKVNAALLIIGDGPLRARLSSQIGSLGLSRRVIVKQRVPDIQPYLRAASLFAMPSVTRAEAFGLVQVEAMACGTPVINTDLPSGVPEVSLHGVTGLTVAPCNSEELASAINLLLEDDALRVQYGLAAQMRARNFTADLMAERIESVYASVGITPGGHKLPLETETSAR